MPKPTEEMICKQLGGHINPLTGECDFSDYEKRVGICSYLLSILGIMLLIIRLASIPTYADIRHASNFLIIIASLALIVQLRSSYLNSILMTSTPLLFALAVYDTVVFFAGINPTIWNITYHIPPFILGILIFFKRYNTTNLVSVALGSISLFAWYFFIDPRGQMFPFFYFVILVHGIPTILVAIDLYRNGAISGVISDPFCE